MLSEQEEFIVKKWVIEHKWISNHIYAPVKTNLNPPTKINGFICKHDKCKGHSPNFALTGKTELVISSSWHRCCGLWSYKIIVNYQSTCSVCGISKWNNRNNYLYFCSCCQQVFTS